MDQTFPNSQTRNKNQCYMVTLFDFTEALKKIEIEYPYPRKVGKNKYEIAPGMYCNKNGLNDFFEEWKRTLGQKLS